jgi:hypothetical protein
MEAKIGTNRHLYSDLASAIISAGGTMTLGSATKWAYGRDSKRGRSRLNTMISQSMVRREALIYRPQRGMLATVATPAVTMNSDETVEEAAEA